MRKICYIVGAGNSEGLTFRPAENDLVIAADGGYAVLKELGIKPQFALGDFDSLGYIPDDVEHLSFPPEKDDTDMRLAIFAARERGYDDIVIFGGLGGRLDHTIGNIQNLQHISHAGRGWLWGEETAATVVTNGSITFPGKCKGMFSVFALGGDAEGVSLNNCKYTLQDAVLHCDVPLGVSNEFVGEEAHIIVQKGSLLVIWNCTCAEFDKMIKDGYC